MKKLFGAMRNVSGSRREHREVIYLRKRPFCIEDPGSWVQSWEAEIPQFPSVPPNQASCCDPKENKRKLKDL